MHSCHYCQIFKTIESKLRRVEGRNGRKFYYRFCKEVGYEVQADSEPCEFFRPAQYFWCKKDDNWMHVLACLNRPYKCKQKADVLDAIRGFDIRKEFGLKPVLVKREHKEKKKPKSKPKLIIRKKKVILIKRNKPKLVRRTK